MPEIYITIVLSDKDLKEEKIYSTPVELALIKLKGIMLKERILFQIRETNMPRSEK